MRRVDASDVGEETLARLEAVVDELAISYPTTPPRVLLGRVRKHLGYVDRLFDGRKTMAEHQRLLVVGGWLSLLGATAHIDLNDAAAARARLKAAASLAKHAGHDEIRAWCCETEAWRVLTDGDYPRALELARAGKALAPAGSSAAVQSTAQMGRAYARLGQRAKTRAALSEVHRLVSAMKRPDQPEHHYRYDPDKAVAYTATTLAWVGDVAAEDYAREIIKRLAPADDVSNWPRRVASANIDLSLALLVANRMDEAAGHTMRAIASGQVVPSNHWRAAEVVAAVEAGGLPEATDLREAYEQMRR
ncbi:transcriptional regulator [Nocardia sp. NRRL S-836]|uniref:transcriptional regulator n=1 Tax=Nocardia sp. NRRL S-836 TaxID=1519492 RepID=UPI0012F9DE26|nr:transcriptional regulator [Nocardia sp. NRRL S-836]